jgi:hypothetical protein
MVYYRFRTSGAPDSGSILILPRGTNIITTQYDP